MKVMERNESLFVYIQKSEFLNVNDLILIAALEKRELRSQVDALQSTGYQ